MAVSSRLHDTTHIRNIAFAGHAGAGKTTLLETLLAKTGATHAAGSVEKGTAVTDFTDQEKRVKHSLESAICTFDIDDVVINALDTPGYPDFVGRAMSVLPAVETAAIVVNAQTGVEITTQRIMDFASERKLCRLVIVNKIDAEDVNLDAVLSEIREAFGAECLPLNLPADGGARVADCFFTHETDVATDYSSVEQAHTEIVDQVVELDDQLMELYLEQGEELSAEQLHDPFEKALRRGHLIPVCFVSAETGAGINQLLRIMTQLMPNPREANAVEFVTDAEATVEATEKSGDHFIGHVFRVIVDPYLGKMGVFRVHQGVVKAGDTVFLGDQRKGFKIAHLYRLQGQETVEIQQGVPGDICAISKVEELYYDAIIHSSHDEDQYHLSRISLPAPMYGVALELARRGDEKKMSDALHRITAADPSLALEFNAHANETVLRGMGELHLRMVLERMRDEFNIDVTTHPPSIAYRETITRKAEGHARHKKQTGGAGQFGEVYLRVEPLSRGTGFEFVDKVVGGAIPSQFIPAVEKGVRQVLEEGTLAGYPMCDIRVAVYDGKHHPVDSKEVAFVAAGKKAFADAIGKAEPIILEPIANVEVTTPGQFMGDITGQLAGIRGRINGNDTLSNRQVRISAEVPVSELTDYQTTLKSLTGGEGAYTMSLDHYATVPPDIQKKLVGAFRPASHD